MTLHERVEDIEWLVRCGETHLEAIARRVGVQPRSVVRALERSGRDDLRAKLIGDRKRGAE
jgi:hypothetical protein